MIKFRLLVLLQTMDRWEEEDPGAVLDYEFDLDSDGEPLEESRIGSLEEPLEESPAASADVTTPSQRRKKKRDKKLACPTCDLRTEHVKRHVLKFHLPWFWVPDLACWTCNKAFRSTTQLQDHCQMSKHLGTTGSKEREKWIQLINGSLDLVYKTLQLEGLTSLFQHIQKTSSLRPTYPIQLSTAEEETLKDFSQSNGFVHPEFVDVRAVSCPAAIIHWRVIARVLSLLSRDDQRAFRRTEVMVDEVGLSHNVTGVSTASDSVVAVDSHFHLDKLLQRSRKATLRQVEEMVQPTQSVSKFVAVYCFPTSWPSLKLHQTHAQDQRLYFTYGIHPRQASSTSRSEVSAVSDLLRRPRVVALGEIGLDYGHHDEPDRRQQQRVLEQLLPLAKEHHLPVVLHCRGRGLKLATPDCVRLVKRHLPSDHPIHLHCFSDGLVEMRMWRRAFPDIFIGFTASLLRDNRHSELDAVVRDLSADHLLIETDAPYLLPPDSESTRFNTPWSISQVAARLAQLRGTSFVTILETTAAHAARLYHF